MKLHLKAGYIGARPECFTLTDSLLQRTAGPYIWVMSGHAGTAPTMEQAHLIAAGIAGGAANGELVTCDRKAFAPTRGQYSVATDAMRYLSLADRAVIIAMVAMRMVQVAINQVVHMVPMRYRLVSIQAHVCDLRRDRRSDAAECTGQDWSRKPR